MFNRRNNIKNENGYTFVHAIFQLINVALFASFIVLIYIVLNQLLQVDKQVEDMRWEVFISELNEYLLETNYFQLANQSLTINVKIGNNEKRSTLQTTKNGEHVNLLIQGEGFTPMYTNAFIEEILREGLLFRLKVLSRKNEEKERQFVIPNIQ